RGLMTLPTHLSLFHNDLLLAELTVCKPSDEMFWLACKFNTTTVFEDLKAEFQPDLSLPDDSLEINSDSLERLALVNHSDGHAFEFFTIFITEDTATVRFA